MRVLLVGGTRFVGRALAFRLLAGGHRVTLLTRGRAADPFGDRVERLVADRAGPDLGRVLARVGDEVHRRAAEALAGRVGHYVMVSTGQVYLVRDGARFAAVDLVAYTGEDGRRAAEALAGRVGHYVMVSTGQVYLVRDGARFAAEGRAAREEDYEGPVLPRPEGGPDLSEWSYGVGKRDCEDALDAAYRRDRFPATRVRIPMVNGELDYYRRVEAYLWRLLDGGPVLVPDAPPRVRHVYGAEVARFLAELLGRPGTYGRAYNLAQDEAPSLLELVGLLRAAIGSRSELVPVAHDAVRAAGLEVAAVSPFSTRWMSFLDPARAREELGFRHLPLAEYLGRIVASHLAHPPSEPPPGWEARGRELALAAAIAA